MGFSNLSIHGLPIHADFILHGLSTSFHAVFLLGLSLFWVSRRRKDGERSHTKRPSLYKETLFTCLSLGVLYLLFSIVGYMDGWWPDANIAAAVDFAVRAVAWLAIALYLHFEAIGRYPAFLRIWWILFLLVSVFHLVGDITGYVEVGDMVTHLWVLDVGSIVAGLILGYVGVFGIRGEDGSNDLQEPLLQGASADGSTSTHSTFSNAGFFSRLTFSWMNPVFSIGHEKQLDMKDVPELAPEDSSSRVFSSLKETLESQIRNDGIHGSDTSSRAGRDANAVTSLKLAKALFFLVKREILFSGLLYIINTLTSYSGPILVKFFVQYITGIRHFANEGYILGFAFIVSKLLECLTNRHVTLVLQRAHLKIRASVVAMIYQKGLTMSSNSKQGRAIGETVNIMSVDAVNIGTHVFKVHDVWKAPVEVVLALLILYYTVGLAALTALAAAFITSIFISPFGMSASNFYKKVMDYKDARMKATSEILRNMRVLKFQAWEMKFLTKITDLREKEEIWLKKLFYVGVIFNAVSMGTPTFIATVTFTTCIFMGIPLELANVLSALATINHLQQPMTNLFRIILDILQIKVSFDRITSYLSLAGLQEGVVQKLPRGSSEVAVEVSNGTFSWDLSSDTPTVTDLNIRVLRGNRVAICGAVGSGKSSLLSSILGEVPKVSGTVKLCGTVAYVAQSPWIQSGGIQDNILFGLTMNQEKYESVLEACSLKEDFEKLPFGDKTIIGERGINLSGGQKQRIQIARALYHDADIFIFDDPFSAVDAHTGTHLFKECLLRFLASKTVLYVTHQVEFLAPADLILVMKDGRITQAGKYDDILHSGVDFMELVGAHKDALVAINSVGLSAKGSSNIAGDNSCGSEIRDHGLHDGGKQTDTPNEKTDERLTDNGQLVQEEVRERGRVGLWVYWRYITLLYKGALVPVLLLCYCFLPALQYARSYWTAWAVPESKGAEAPVSGLLFVCIFVALAFAGIITILALSLLIGIVGYKTGTIMFNKMHMCIFRAPMSFFDSTPSGRILNRASADQTDVDMGILSKMFLPVLYLLHLLTSIAVMSQISWQILIIFVPVISASIWYQRYYIVPSRELVRLIGVSAAPNIQHFSESLLGSMTIRSFNQESRFVNTNFDLMDVFSRPRFYNTGAIQWLGFRLDMLSFIAFSVCLILLISLPQGIVSPAIAGLALTYALNVSSLQFGLVWSVCDLEKKIVCVERIFQYMSIPSEPPLTIEATKPVCNWPTKGEVTVQNLQVRYRPNMPLVLKGITCSFAGGKKTGIVGRTGCGKTTLIQALFRVVDHSAGQIIIDGIDISTLGLHDLRSKLSIIPQDPTMFGGTIRSNLDPLEEYTDEQIWKALDSCQLGDEIRKNPLKLDSEVTENGENWSMGQRQLVCLSRVILKKSKILVLDEATASVDTATDSLIQKTLRQEFSDSTVIAIAHRITSILDSDMILLLDNGKIAENDTPARLLENKSSLFSKLVSEYVTRSSSPTS